MQNIYILYADKIKKFLICLTNNYELTEELTQETFFQAYKSIERYNGQCKMTVWLCQIAKHLFYDYLKKQKHYISANTEEVVDIIIDSDSNGKSLEEQIIIKEQANEIYKKALAMREPYGKVFLLRTLGEMNFQEIGEIFNKSDNWARVTYYRAKSILREKMRGDGYGI